MPFSLGRLFSVRPRIRKEQEALIAETAPHIAVLTLGLKWRRVLIDNQHRAIRIFARYLWLFPRVRYIPFDVVDCVLYTYAEVSPLGGIPGTAYQEQDLFTVRVRLRNGKEVLLARFFGQGDFINNSVWPDWTYWENAQIARLTQGSQEDESRLYATMVAALIGVEVRND